MFQPQRAPVRPRVLCPQSGEALPLEDEVRALIEARARGLIQITGPAGSGKTTALRHLAAVLFPGAVTFIDDSPRATVKSLSSSLVVYATREPRPEPYLAVYRMAPWGEDEWIEYLLAAHRERCGSAVKRLRAAPDRDLLPPLPEVWKLILDEMAVGEAVVGVRQALQRVLAWQLPDRRVREAVRMGCLRLLLPAGAVPRSFLEKIEQSGQHLRYPPLRPLWCLLRHEAVQVMQAAEQVVSDLRDGSACDYLQCRLPRDLVRETAARAVTVPEALEHLRQFLAGGPKWHQAMAASILHATDTGWAPESDHKLRLYGAYLEGAAWPYVRLPKADLREADLGGAYLHEANLAGADAGRARLSGATLQGADLTEFRAYQADLTSADLSRARAEKAAFQGAVLERANLDNAVFRTARFAEAKLAGASFVEADLSGACLKGADITDADFTSANLEGASLAKLSLRKATFTGARFVRTDLRDCDLEYLQLPAADFSGADLEGAYLTGSWMPEANFEKACLCRTGLADVNWAGANLRGADLRGASFHAGSSRSGLVFSPIASEGSRTGFYTDDSEEQYFKAPEEIRKANLCGADLRGAALRTVDFYLVDLRGALFDPEQEQHFRRCRAILEARV
jgi:uncharacterized protein YjbI with pentapeptide repeats